MTGVPVTSDVFFDFAYTDAGMTDEQMDNLEMLQLVENSWTPIQGTYHDQIVRMIGVQTTVEEGVFLLSTTVLPEPATLSMILLGTLAILRRRIGKRSPRKHGCAALPS